MKNLIITLTLTAITVITFIWAIDLKCENTRLHKYEEVTNTLLNRIYIDDPTYYLDVLTETDEYQDYAEILDIL